MNVNGVYIGHSYFKMLKLLVILLTLITTNAKLNQPPHEHGCHLKRGENITTHACNPDQPLYLGAALCVCNYDFCYYDGVACIGKQAETEIPRIGELSGFERTAGAIMKYIMEIKKLAKDIDVFGMLATIFQCMFIDGDDCQAKLNERDPSHGTKVYSILPWYTSTMGTERKTDLGISHWMGHACQEFIDSERLDERAVNYLTGGKGPSKLGFEVTFEIAFEVEMKIPYLPVEGAISIQVATTTQFFAYKTEECATNSCTMSRGETYGPGDKFTCSYDHCTRKGYRCTEQKEGTCKWKCGWERSYDFGNTKRIGSTSNPVIMPTEISINMDTGFIFGWNPTGASWGGYSYGIGTDIGLYGQLDLFSNKNWKEVHSQVRTFQKLKGSTGVGSGDVTSWEFFDLESHLDMYVGYEAGYAGPKQSSMTVSANTNMKNCAEHFNPDITASACCMAASLLDPTCHKGPVDAYYVFNNIPVWMSPLGLCGVCNALMSELNPQQSLGIHDYDTVLVGIGAEAVMPDKFVYKKIISILGKGGEKKLLGEFGVQLSQSLTNGYAYIDGLEAGEIDVAFEIAGQNENIKTCVKPRVPAPSNDVYGPSTKCAMCPIGQIEPLNNFVLIKMGHELATADTNLQTNGNYLSLQDCAAACEEQQGCKYFISGTSAKVGSCYWERIGDTQYELEDYVNINLVEGTSLIPFVANDYDLYTLGNGRKCKSGEIRLGWPNLKYSLDECAQLCKNVNHKYKLIKRDHTCGEELYPLPWSTRGVVNNIAECAKACQDEPKCNYFNYGGNREGDPIPINHDTDMINKAIDHGCSDGTSTIVSPIGNYDECAGKCSADEDCKFIQWKHAPSSFQGDNTFTPGECRLFKTCTKSAKNGHTYGEKSGS